MRVFVTSAYYSTIFIYLFIELSVKKGTTKMQSVIGWIALIFSLANIVRGLYTVFSDFEIPVYTNIHVQIVLGLAWVIVAYTFPLLFLFILKEHDNIKLKELNATKDKFFRIIGHDLKAPISQVIQISEVIEENISIFDQNSLLSFVKSMKESSVNGLKLLDNLLDWARSQTGCIKFSPQQFSLKDLIRRNISMLEDQAESKNIKIVDSTVMKVNIIADENMINTVVRNMLSNAIKFTKENGKIGIENTIEKDSMIISIKDNGVGISSSDCDKLFNIDSIHTTAGTNNEVGTGIGLIVCKEFIDKHQGKIWVESEVGKGSVFKFKIPMK